MMMNTIAAPPPSRMHVLPSFVVDDTRADCNSKDKNRSSRKSRGRSRSAGRTTKNTPLPSEKKGKKKNVPDSQVRPTNVSTPRRMMKGDAALLKASPGSTDNTASDWKSWKENFDTFAFSKARVRPQPRTRSLTRSGHSKHGSKLELASMQASLHRSPSTQRSRSLNRSRHSKDEKEQLQSMQASLHLQSPQSSHPRHTHSSNHVLEASNKVVERKATSQARRQHSGSREKSKVGAAPMSVQGTRRMLKGSDFTRRSKSIDPPRRNFTMTKSDMILSTSQHGDPSMNGLPSSSFQSTEWLSKSFHSACPTTPALERRLARFKSKCCS